MRVRSSMSRALYAPPGADVHTRCRCPRCGTRPGTLAAREGICYKTIVRPRAPRLAAKRAAVMLAAALSLASCQRTASTGANAAGLAKQPATLSGSPAPKGAATSGPVPAAALPAKPTPAAAPRSVVTAPSTPASTPASSPAPVVRADAGLFGLLCQGAQDGNLPEDFEIGPLGAARLLADDERLAYAAAAAMLDAFSRGQVDRAVIAAGSRDALAGTIAFALERGDLPVAWRLGPPRADGSELVANVRLLGADGSAEGEIYARRESGSLLVSDLQIDPARMRVRRAKPDRTFFPSPYRWLLGG
jgi:hypothetical protein